MAGGEPRKSSKPVPVFDAQAAAYRLTVLRALQEVEDALVQLSVLAQTQKVQRRAVMAADESLRMTRNQYKQGLVDYVTVALLETTALNNQRNEIAIMGNRLSASVRLVAALGGGWSTEQLPNPSDTVSARRQSPLIGSGVIVRRARKPVNPPLG